MTFGKGNPMFGKRPGAKSARVAVGDMRAADKRRSERIAEFKNGKVLLPKGPAIDCIVRNHSDHGCLISFVGAESLPETVTIRLDILSPARPARVVWRDRGVAGLEFLETSPPPQADRTASP